MKPDMQEVVVAYYLSAVTIEYIAARHGFDKIVEGLKLFGKGLETPAVIEKITGQTVREFDAAFRVYLESRLTAYRGTWKPPTVGYDDVTKLEVAVGARPRDPEAYAALALGHFYDGDAVKAQDAANRALAMAPENRIALYVAAEVALRTGGAARAKDLYVRLIEAGGDSFDVRGRLAAIAKQEGDAAEAIRQLCAAKRLDPERSDPYMELFEVHEQAGDMDAALAELETYVVIEQMQYGPVKRLVDEYAKKKAWAKVRTYGEMAVMINPSDAELFLKLGAAYLETGAPDRSLFTYDSALIAEPKLRRPALAHLGRAKALLAKKQRRKARAALREALKLEPENAEVLALQKKLR
jgi:tetratricopeptide (TPR) repeat protein